MLLISGGSDNGRMAPCGPAQDPGVRLRRIHVRNDSMGPGDRPSCESDMTESSPCTSRRLGA
jgi:hypothetical protein